MDNLSHSMVGLFVGEVVHQVLPQAKDPRIHEQRRKLFLGSSVLASSFPDLDLILSPLLSEPLGYLLHHRGHTHVFVYLIPQLLLLMALLLAFPGVRRLLKADPSVWKGWLLTLGASLVLHIGCDFLNSYGVHPFHPWNSNWFYGDLVFIIEPVFWVTLGVAFGLTLKTKWRRIALTGSLVGLPIILTALHLLSPFTGAFLVSLAALVALAHRRSQALGLAFGFVLWAGFLFVQFVASTNAFDQVSQALHEMEKEETLRDVVLTPLPTNPACWNFVVLSDKATEYMVRKGRISIYPERVRVEDCRWIQPMAISNAEKNIQWEGVEVNSLDQLQQGARSNCHFNAWLRFARAPVKRGNYVTDVRFSGLQEYNFTTMMWSEENCSGLIPEWGYPRADLIFGETL